MDIVIGYQGKDHVRAEQLRRLIAGMAGEGTYVLGTQNALAATMVTANQVRIDTGDVVASGGAYATVETPETLTVESGVTGQKRNDVVVARYEKDASTNVESMELAVVKGTHVSYGDPTDPELSEGSIMDGDSPVEVPLWRIPIDGLAPGTPVKLFETIPTIDSLRDSVSQNAAVVAGLGQTVDVKQDQTFTDIVVTAKERAGTVTVSVERWGKSGVATIFSTPSVAGHVKAGHRPSRSYRQLLGVKGDGSWLYMEVDAAGAVKVGTLYAPGDSSTWGSFSGTISYPVA